MKGRWAWGRPEGSQCSGSGRVIDRAVQQRQGAVGKVQVKVGVPLNTLNRGPEGGCEPAVREGSWDGDPELGIKECCY